MRKVLMVIVVLGIGSMCVWAQSVKDIRLDRFCFVLWHEDVDPYGLVDESSLSEIYFNVDYPMVRIDFGKFDFLISSPVDGRAGTMKSRILAKAPQGVDYALYWADGSLAYYLTIMEVNNHSGRANKIKLFNGSEIYYGFARS